MCVLTYTRVILVFHKHLLTLHLWLSTLCFEPEDRALFILVITAIQDLLAFLGIIGLRTEQLLDIFLLLFDLESWISIAVTFFFDESLAIFVATDLNTVESSVLHACRAELLP